MSAGWQSARRARPAPSPARHGRQSAFAVASWTFIMDRISPGIFSSSCGTGRAWKFTPERWARGAEGDDLVHDAEKLEGICGSTIGIIVGVEPRG